MSIVNKEAEYFKQNELCVNVQSVIHCNEANITEQEFEGKKHIVIKDVKHMIADTVMNGILYPNQAQTNLLSELEQDKTYTAAPAGHPVVNGKFVSASDPRSLIQHGVGAFHFNWREDEDNRLVSDTAIDPEIAKTSEKGRELLTRIANNQDIDISTGFFLKGNQQDGYGSDGKKYHFVANVLKLDHSALLLHEPGAKTSDEGVGVFANQDQEYMVVNSSLAEAEPFYQDTGDSILDKVRNMFRINGLKTEEDCSILPDIESGLQLDEINPNQESGMTDYKMTSDEEVMKYLKNAGMYKDGMTNEMMRSKYNEMMKDKDMPKKEKMGMNSDEIASIVANAVATANAPLLARLDQVETSLKANQQKEVDEMAQIVANSSMGIDLEEAKNIPVATLRKMASQGRGVQMIGGGMQVNRQDDVLSDMEAPE